MQAAVLEGKLTDWRIAVDGLHKSLANTGLNERQIDGIIYAAKSGYITRKGYIEIANVSPLTATRDIKELVKRDLLIPTGKGRNRKYIIKQFEKEKAK